MDNNLKCICLYLKKRKEKKYLHTLVAPLFGFAKLDCPIKR